MEFIDTHCHIHFDSYPLDKSQVLNDALAAGVKKIICVGTTVTDSRQAIAFAAAHENVWATAGVHPHGATEFASNKNMQLDFTEILNKSSIVAVGEIGLDYYKNYAPQKDQQEALKIQIEAGIITGKPFIFHVRDSWDDFWKIFDSYKNLSGVVHSFSSNKLDLDQVLARNLYIGLNGIMTFTSDDEQLQAAKVVPLDRLLLETDAPFLTPKPYRGKTCEPKHVLNTAEFLAELRGESIEEISKATTNNAKQLFNIT